MSRFATIDVGSNSVLIHIAERLQDNTFKVLDDKSELSRLGEGLQTTGIISEEACNRTVKALAEFKKMAEDNQVQQIAAVGTMCLRNASNSGAFIKRVKDECGIEIEVVSGEEEARLAFMAVKSGLSNDMENIVIFDVGGGSTEFIFGSGKNIDDKFSLNIGAIRLTEQFLTSDPVIENELSNLLSYLDGAFSKISDSKSCGVLVGIGGTITNMAAVKHEMRNYDPDRIRKTILSTKDVSKQLELYKSLTINQRQEIPGLQPKRADVILAGAAIVKVVMDKLNLKTSSISDRGIRHGIMADRFGN